MNCTNGNPCPVDSKINAIKSLAFLSLFLLSPGLVGIAHSQIFVSNSTASTVSEYSLSGTQMSPALISGLGNPYGLATDGSHLFVPMIAGNKASIAEYALSGEPLNTSFIPGGQGPLAVGGNDLFLQELSRPEALGEYTTDGAPVNTSLIPLGTGRVYAIAVQGDDIFISYAPFLPPIAGVEFTIGEYTTSGMPVNPTLITGQGFVGGLAVQGNDLFLTNIETGSVDEYSTDGTLLKASLIPGLNNPTALTLHDNDLFVVNFGSGTIGEYTTSGDPVAPSLITGLTGDIYGIAVVPEPASFALLALASGGFFLRRRTRNHTSNSI